jgi:GST-like protein
MAPSLVEGPERSIVVERFMFFITDVIAQSGASFYLSRRNHSGAAEMLEDRTLDALVGAERFLERSRFMAGDAFSVADIAGLTITAFAKGKLPWDRLPKLEGWFQLVESRPAVRRAYAALGMTY